MHPNDLIGRVLLDALGAGVPGHDASIAVEKVNGVVAYTLNDRAELLVVPAQSLLRIPLLGHIADKAQHDRPGAGIDGLEHDVDRELGAILAQSKEVHGGAHLAGSRVGVVVFAMAGVARAEARRNQVLNWLAE